MKDNFKKWVIVSTLFMFALTTQAGIYTFKVTNYQEGQKLILIWNDDKTQELVKLTNGEGCIERSNFHAQYVTLKFGNIDRLMYINPINDLEVSFDAKTFYLQINFSGKDSDINRYLNQTEFAKTIREDARNPESVFIQKIDSVFQVNLSILEKAKLDKSFTEKEKIRLTYYSYAMLPDYQKLYKYLNKIEDFTPSNNYYDKLNKLQVYDEKLLAYSEYKSFISKAVEANVSRYNEKNSSQYFMNYVTVNIKNAKVLEYVTDSYIYNKIFHMGVDDADDLIAFYHQHVTDLNMIKRFDAICSDWSLVKAGQPSPVFTFPDINGKMISLSDLRGNYVYIDVWATWCAPCRGELPYLKKLEEFYSGKNIKFVSLSCDRDKTAWKQMIKNDKMRGIQLYMGYGNQFMNQYMIETIPRFILLDTEGRILKANAPRPSDPKIKDILSSLVK